MEGHLAYLANAGYPLEFLECSDSGRPASVDRSTLRALEIDADTHAMVTHLYATLAPGSHPAMTPEWVLASKKDLIDGLFGACCSGFLLSRNDSLVSLPFSMRQHPPAAVRVHMLLHAFSVLLEQAGVHVDIRDELVAESIKTAKQVAFALDAEADLGVVVQMQMGTLAADHPHQVARAEVYTTLQSIGHEVGRFGDAIKDLMGVDDESPAE
jgi:hypothetical protein